MFLDPEEARRTGSGGRRSVPVPSSPGRWSIADDSQTRFREGFAYLFYIRPRYESPFGEAFGRVRPLRHFLSRRLPDVKELSSGEAASAGEQYGWAEPPRLRNQREQSVSADNSRLLQ